MKGGQPLPDPGAEPRLVIVGGGFAGIWAAIGAAAKLHEEGAIAAITLVSADPWMTIRQRLYERAPATSGSRSRDCLRRSTPNWRSPGSPRSIR
jgi:NADH dehydrogenase FAD-containing subunit